MMNRSFTVIIIRHKKFVKRCVINRKIVTGLVPKPVWSWNSSVSIVTDYGQENWGLKSHKGKISLFSSSGAHPASYPKGTRGDFLKGKAARV
jgi:hypothetical protein